MEDSAAIKRLKTIGAILIFGLLIFSIMVIVLGVLSGYLYFPEQEKIKLWENTKFIIGEHPLVFTFLVATLFVFMSINMNKSKTKR